MCDPGLILGIATGVANTAAQASTANANNATAVQQANMEHGAQQREFLVQARAAQKDAHQAALEGDRAKSAAITSGAGQRGSTMGLRTAEQSRQTALSIGNARDRTASARANYSMEGVHSQVHLQNHVNTNQISPMSAFMDVATSGLRNYGAFKSK